MDSEKTKKAEITLKGIPVSPGIAIGPAFVLRHVQLRIPRKIIPVERIPEEIQAFQNARRELIAEMELTQRNQPPKMAQLLETQILILEDKQFVEGVIHSIERQKVRADYAVQKVAKDLARQFEESENRYLKERASEVLQIAKELISKMHATEPSTFLQVKPGTVIFSDDLSVKETIYLTQKDIRAVVLQSGGQTSHAAIILRDFQIPGVFCVEGMDTVKNGQRVIVDGNLGTVILYPRRHTRKMYVLKMKEFQKFQTDLLRLKGTEAITEDGFQIGLSLNIDFPEELAILDRVEKRGIGLFRTEILFYTGRLDEETQYRIYQEMADRVYPFTATIRAFDIGGDKFLGEKEDNPFLGLRGIRLLLKEKDQKTLRTQLRAVIRANERENLKFMLPMVSTLEEILEFKEILAEVSQEVHSDPERRRCCPDIGIMVETPAAALMVDALAREVNFVSIGTNDLTQYVLAVDRKNPKVSYLFNHLHPAVLRLLDETVRKAHSQNVLVSVCGEMAADPLAIPLLVGMDVDELSVVPAYLLQTKEVIRSISKEKARVLKEEVLNLKTAEEVRQVVLEYLKGKIRELIPFIPLSQVDSSEIAV